jgi:hypothetical protein
MSAVTTSQQIEDEIENLITQLKRSIVKSLPRDAKMINLSEVALYTLEEQDDCYIFTDKVENSIPWKSYPVGWLTIEVQNRILNSLRSYMNDGMNPSYGTFELAFTHVNMGSLFLNLLISYCYVVKSTLDVVLYTSGMNFVASHSSNNLTRSSSIERIISSIYNGVAHYLGVCIPDNMSRFNKVCILKESYESLVDSLSNAQLASITESCMITANKDFPTLFKKGKVEISYCVVNELTNRRTRTHEFYIKYTPTSIVASAYDAFIAAKANHEPVINSRDVVMAKFFTEFLVDIESKFASAVEKKDFYFGKKRGGVVLYKGKSNIIVEGISMFSAISLWSDTEKMLAVASDRINNSADESHKVQVGIAYPEGYIAIIASFV